MNKFPIIKFKISPKKDFEIYRGFIETAELINVANDLKIGFYNIYPKLTKIKNKKISEAQKSKLINDFIENFYGQNLPRIKAGVVNAEKKWDGVEKFFFKEISKIFNNYPWPKGKYIAYATIWGLYPRFLDDKTFSIPYEHKDKNYNKVVIAHEMLHFIFYDYLFTYFPRLKKQKYEKVVWDLAEVFNVIIQYSPNWVKKFKSKPRIYPAHKELIVKLKRLWCEENNLNKFLEKAIKLLIK